MNLKNVILNFSDVYVEESFYQNKHFSWIDCKDICGTDCLCDTDAAREIERRIKKFTYHGLHFIDSGNYHYISKFWTDKINFPFVLIVFDHHPDMQQPLFENVLSCGSWVKDALDENKFLKKVVLVGADDQLLQHVNNTYGDRLVIYSESTLFHKETWKKFADIHVKEPVYISIDKDVLSEKDEKTNWDQGRMRIDELKALLTIILRHAEVCGIDICGTCPLTISQMVGLQEIKVDDHVNKELLNLFNGFDW